MFIRACVVLFCLCFGAYSFAGFLEMPDIEEVPEAKNDILLEDLDIPNVRERDPNPEAGPRLNVKSFRVQGIVEFPELGITREALIKLVENIRFDIMQEGKRSELGYTTEELSELQDVIADIERDTRGEHVTQLEVQRLVFLIREQRRRRGVTLGMLETVADQITDYYRQRGFILARAFLPEQRVRDGVVTITLLLGNLGNIELSNNTRYSQDLIKNVFADTIGEPVTAKVIEEKLYHVNDLPGIAVQGFFAPGVQVGDTQLNVNVLNEKLFNYNLRMDNHGSTTTGEYRFYGDFIWNSPFKYGDRLHIAGLYAVEPETANYGSIRYGGPLFNYRWQYDLGYSQNAYITELSLRAEADPAVTFRVTEVGGSASTFDASLRYKIARSRVKSTSAGLRFAQVDTLIEITTAGEGVIEASDDRVFNATLFYDFDFVREAKRSIHNGSIRLVATELADSGVDALTDSGDNPTLADGTEVASVLFEDTVFLQFNYSYLKFFRFPFTDTDVRGKLTLQGQYAGKPLSSVNQYGLGGPSKARAFATNVFFSDDGANLSAELVLRRFQPLKYLGLQPYAFFEAAYGAKFIIGIESPNEEVQISGFGIGSNLDFGKKGFTGYISLGVPLDEPEEEDDLDSAKVYASFQYSF